MFAQVHLDVSGITGYINLPLPPLTRGHKGIRSYTNINEILYGVRGARSTPSEGRASQVALLVGGLLNRSLMFSDECS